MTETTSSEAVERELGGCPVMHRDFSGSQAAGCHWELAEELREASPLHFNTFAQGYWVFTRYDAVRDMYKSPEIFSSESITPWQPDPIYRFVPTQIDPPDHIQYRRILNPAGSSTRSPRSAAATSSPSSRCVSPPRRS
jgi:cytochrome P450